MVYAGNFGEIVFICAVSGERQQSAWTNFWPRVRRNGARCTSPCILYLHCQTFVRPLVRPSSPLSPSSSPPMFCTDPLCPYRKTAGSPGTFSRNPLYMESSESAVLRRDNNPKGQTASGELKEPSTPDACLAARDTVCYRNRLVRNVRTPSHNPPFHDQPCSAPCVNPWSLWSSCC